MVNLRIPRPAKFAWSESTSRPFIATGTVAGALDSDFSNATSLELWDLAFDDNNEDAELTPTASISTDSRFYDIAWGSKGVIAGGLESGALNLWKADSIIEGDSTSESITKHTDAIKALSFSPVRSSILATAGGNGELYVWDLNKPSDAILMGGKPQRTDEYTTVAWNHVNSNILVTGGKNCLVGIWDLRGAKQWDTLKALGKKEVGAVAWHPFEGTQFLTGLADDSNPVVMLWDLRKLKEPHPVQVLSGHDQGILSLDWCKHDTEILLSSGKDNKTICWNPVTGAKLGEFPLGTDWAIQTRFNPKNPDIVATASLDGKITIQSLQSKSKDAPASHPVSTSESDDFFSLPNLSQQGPSFSLQQAPKWHKRPVGASFGFGGKLVSFETPGFSTGKRVSSFKITSTGIASESTAAIESFEAALKTDGLTELCDKRIEESQSDEEKEEWTIIKSLFDSQPQKKIVEHLGFSSAEPAKVETAGLVNGATSEAATADADVLEDEEDFFGSAAPSKPATTGEPFTIAPETESQVDKDITKALILGNFARAVDICIAEDRLTDAFVLAVAGGEESVQKVQKAYFAKQSEGPSYVRLLSSVVGKNLSDTVQNATLDGWKEVLCTLCTFANKDEFAKLCEDLGDRLRSESTDDNDRRQDAMTCYLIGCKLEKIVAIWIEEYKEEEAVNLQDASGGSETFSIHVKSLQQVIEKVTIFREATKFVDPEINNTSDWKLSALYGIYSEYADVLAAEGQLAFASKYLQLIPKSFSAAETVRNRVEVASGPAATKKASTSRNLPAAAALRTQTRSPYAVTPAVSAQPSMFQPIQPSAPTYTPPTRTPAQAPLNAAPSATQSRYTPAAQASQPTPQATPQVQNPYSNNTGGYGYPQPAPYGQGPYGGRITPQPPRNASPAQGANVRSYMDQGPAKQWNDTDELGLNTLPPKKRQPTPQAIHQQAPFPNAPGILSPTTATSAYPPPPPRSSTPQTAGPPPKRGESAGGASVVRAMSPAIMNPYGRPQTPGSQTGSYVPQASPPRPVQPMAPPRPASTAYSQPPPSSTPSSAAGRYTPSQPQATTSGYPGQVGPPSQQHSQFGAPPNQPPYNMPPQSRPGPPGGINVPPPPGRTPIAPPPRAQGATPTPPPPRSNIAPPPRATTSATAPAPAESLAQQVEANINTEIARILSILPPDDPALSARRPALEEKLNILRSRVMEGAVKPDTIQDLFNLTKLARERLFGQANGFLKKVEEDPENSEWASGMRDWLILSKTAKPA